MSVCRRFHFYSYFFISFTNLLSIHRLLAMAANSPQRCWTYCHSLPLLLLLLDRKFFEQKNCVCVWAFSPLLLLLCRIYKMSLTLLVSRVLLLFLTWYLPSVSSLSSIHTRGIPSVRYRRRTYKHSSTNVVIGIVYTRNK